MLKIKEIGAKGYEKVIVGKDSAAGLHAVIAVHNTVLGPGLGGIRMQPYRSEKEALADALRLSKAMTYKAAISHLAIGGGKAVVIGNPQKPKSRKMLLALGDMIESLGGRYLAAEDVGFYCKDLDVIAQRTKHLTGASPSMGGSGDCSPSTSKGIIVGIQTAVQERFKTVNLTGIRIAIQGIGKVGWPLLEFFHSLHAEIFVSDIDPEKCREAQKRFGVKIIPPPQIHKIEAEVFSPCALGGGLNPKTIPELGAKIVAGGANNQFLDEKKGPSALMKREILHAPDFVINAGGIIHLFVKEILKKEDLTPWLLKIGGTLREIFRLSRLEGTAPLPIAVRLAEERIRRKQSS